MRLHPYREQHERLLRIIRDYSSAGAVVDLQVYMGDLDLTDLLEEGDISWDSGSVAWTFSGTFSTRLDVAYRGAPLRVVADVEGIELEIFNGRASLPILSDENSTSIIAGTAGIYLDKVTLDQQVEFSGATPEDVIRNAVYRCPYSRSRVSIAPFETPLIYRGLNASATGDSSGFSDEQHPMDILTSIQEEIDVVYFDSATGGFHAMLNPGVGAGRPLAWEYETDSSEVLEPFSEPTFGTPDEQVTRVVVRDKLEDGSYRVYEEWPVDYSTLRYPPAASSTMYLGVSDTSAEAFEEARALGFSTAESLRNGTFGGGITVACNPLLEPYDVIAIKSEHSDMTGRYRRHWQCVLTGISLRFASDALDTGLSFSAAMVDTTRIEEPRIVVERLSAGVASTPISGFVLGLDYIGEWVDSSRITGPLWAGEDEVGDWFDPELAPAGLLGEETVNGELLDYIDYVSAAGATHGEDDFGEWVDEQFISDPQWSGTERVAFDEVALDWFDDEFAPLGLLGEDGTGDYIDF